MIYRSIKGFTGGAQLALILLVTGIGIVLAMVIQMGVGTMALGIPSNEPAKVAEALKLPQNAGYAQMIQALGTFAMFCLPAFIYLFVCHGRKFIWLGLSQRVHIGQLLLAFGMILFTNYCADSLQQLSKYLLHFLPALDEKARLAEKAYTEQIQAMGSGVVKGALFKAVFIMAILPAFFEEVFFRGTLQGLFTRWWRRPVVVMIMVSLLFSLIHLSYYLFLSRFLLGYLLCWLFYKSGNLWVSIFAHAMNNLLAVIALFSTASAAGKTDVTKAIASSSSHWWLGIPALVLVLAMGYVFKNISASRREAILLEERLLDEKAQAFKDYLDEERNKRK